MITLLLLRSILFIHICVCVYKTVASSVFSVSQLIVITLILRLKYPGSFIFQYERTTNDLEQMKAIDILLDQKVSVVYKYAYTLEFVVWSVFDTSSGNELSNYKPAKILTAGFIITGVAFNVYILIQILNIMNTIHAPRTKFYEIMNQLEAYMQKKQLPIHLQKRLKFFYRMKFQNFYYREDEIFGILSGL